MPKQILGIALCRVSSLEQLESNSLIHQRDNVLRAADELGVLIPEDGIWSGHVSSKKGVNYDRKDLKQMLEYCRQHTNVKYLIVQEVDRFMRSPDEQVYFQVKFMNEVGVKIWYADKPELNKDDIYAGLMRYMEGFRAAGSNDERQRKSINGQIKALEEGRFPFAPKPGYKKGYQTAIQEVHAIKGPILRNILIKIATKRITPSEGLVELNGSDFVIGHSLYKMDKFRKIVTDPFYAGIVEINKQVKVRNENGLHEPLITKEQHIELVNVMNNKKKNQSGPRKNGNPKYQLSNLIYCDTCKDKRYGKFVGFDHTNGVNKAVVYEKYRCRSCGKYMHRHDLHSRVEKLFKPITTEGRKDLIEALNIVWKQEEGQIEQNVNRIMFKIDGINKTIANQVEAATDPENVSIKLDILKSIEKKRNEVIDLEDELAKLSNGADNDKGKFLRFALNFVDDMGNKFFEISKENRLKCKELVFPAGFRIDANNKVYTPEISTLYRLATQKTDTEMPDFSRLVRVRRL